MTDADILSRAAAFDDDGLAVAWTPEAVQSRMIEAAWVFARIPVKIGPAKMKTAWPVFARTAQDLVDDETQTRLMRFPHLVGNWSARVDDATKRQMSRDTVDEWERQPSSPGMEALSRAEEAVRWPAVYLVDQPLLADAISTFSACRGLKRSLDAHMKERRRAADELIGIARAASKERKRGTGRMRLVEIGTLELTRQSLFPGRNFDTAALYARRKAAVEIVCAGLVAARIVLRLADDDESAVSDTE